MSRPLPASVRRRADAPWRLHFVIVLFLSLWLPVAGQLALLCCLPCILHGQPVVAVQGVGDQADHADHADRASDCQTCVACASLLATSLPRLPAVAAAAQPVAHDSVAPVFRVVATRVPFTSRAPPSHLA